MAITFKIYTDSGLTSELGTNLQITHFTDQSDNPQDFGPYYFGSTEASSTLKAQSNPGTDQITLTPTYILDDWEGTTAYVLGDTVIPTTPNGFRYEVTTAGITAGTEPSWPTSIGSTVADGGVIWTCVAGDRPTTEIKLATTSGGLAGATPGAGLDLGTSISSGIANAVEFYMRVTNTITTASSNFGNPELSLQTNAVQEEA